MSSRLFSQAELSTRFEMLERGVKNTNELKDNEALSLSLLLNKYSYDYLIAAKRGTDSYKGDASINYQYYAETGLLTVITENQYLNIGKCDNNFVFNNGGEFLGVTSRDRKTKDLIGFGIHLSGNSETISLSTKVS